MAATPPPPPKLTGDANRDLPAMNQWAWDFYRSVVLEEAYATQADLLQTQTDLTGLIDPAAATAATAQNTANQALTLATTNDGRLDTAEARHVKEDAGQVTISGTATSAAVTGISAQGDTSYEVVITGVDYSGAPSVSAFVVVKVVKAADQFTVHIGAAPGAGNSVTLAYKIVRDDT